MIFEAFYRQKTLLRQLLLGSLSLVFGFFVIGARTADFYGKVPRRLYNLSRIFNATPLETLHGLGVFFIFGAIAILVLCFNYWFLRGPAVRVDDNGIFYHRWSLETVPWENIARADVQNFGLASIIALKLRNRSASRPDTVYGWFNYLVPIRMFGDIPIAWTMMDRTPDEFMAAIARHVARLG